MAVSDDEYDVQAGGAIELTEEDCAMIDALSSSVSSVPHPAQAGMIPHIDVVGSPQGLKAPVKNASNWQHTKNLTRRSPFDLFRHYGRLSVSDLVAPTWCEVQFDYGLRQGRSKRIDNRPKTFVSKDGKVIRAEQKTAQLNDVVLREGNAVHSVLEREIHPVQVPVKTETSEEFWGLRLFNMISDLQTLMLIGKCREFPVMGRPYGSSRREQDEINRTSIPNDPPTSESHKKRPSDASAPSTPSKHKRPKSGGEPSSPEKQPTISSYFPVTPRKSTHSRDSAKPTTENPTPVPQHSPESEAPHTISTGTSLTRTHTLYLIDSKTRLSPSLPHHSATLSSRLQLMTYKRLLDALLSPSPRFDFDKLWKQLRVDSKRLFSEAFMVQVQPLSPAGSKVRCLEELEGSWWAAVRDLRVSEEEISAEGSAPVNEQLTLVYRLRAAGPGGGRKGKDRTSSKPHPRLQRSTEAEDLDKAIRESLRHSLGLALDSREVDDALVGSVLQASTSALQTADSRVEIDERVSAQEALKPEEAPDPEMEWAVQESLKVAYAEPSQQGGTPQVSTAIELTVEGGVTLEATNQAHTEQAAIQHDHATVSPSLQTGDVIGEKQFNYDAPMLDAHLTSILAWWHGEREPRGVEVEQSSRCNTCEYMSACEWREKKAFEVSEIGQGTRW